MILSCEGPSENLDVMYFSAERVRDPGPGSMDAGERYEGRHVHGDLQRQLVRGMHVRGPVF